MIIHLQSTTARRISAASTPARRQPKAGIVPPPSARGTRHSSWNTRDAVGHVASTRFAFEPDIASVAQPAGQHVHEEWICSQPDGQRMEKKLALAARSRLHRAQSVDRRVCRATAGRQPFVTPSRRAMHFMRHCRTLPLTSLRRSSAGSFLSTTALQHIVLDGTSHQAANRRIT